MVVLSALPTMARVLLGWRAWEQTAAMELGGFVRKIAHFRPRPAQRTLGSIPMSSVAMSCMRRWAAVGLLAHTVPKQFILPLPVTPS
ncbi:MAG: hypothetical protein A2341_13410 [Deltaproteobacteria bacterium RIFOXYB12_FULL_58_9]|nr:MAG: hypothetical protein A2341_13410 [Deltaproteobacteria bacterium RIFOXYB12_FULL_58_9]